MVPTAAETYSYSLKILAVHCANETMLLPGVTQGSLKSGCLRLVALLNNGANFVAVTLS